MGFTRGCSILSSLQIFAPDALITEIMPPASHAAWTKHLIRKASVKAGNPSLSAGVAAVHQDNESCSVDGALHFQVQGHLITCCQCHTAVGGC